MSIVVLKTHGKGNGRASFVSVKLFDTEEKANEWCKNNTSLEDTGPNENWTFAEIVEPEVTYEPWYSENIQLNKPQKTE
jgi:hypothetical protein|tara:strand:- start:771 stop:1007 length:237 start_codon:yes stop_codon:yes gene_type:complete